MKLKKWWYVLGLGVGLLFLMIVQWPSDKTKIIACDIGQGDAILVTKGDNQVLIDGGPSGERILACLERHLPFWDRTIELIVLTHADYDHMNGLVSVVDRYKVSRFVTADGVHSTRSLKKLRDELVSKQIKVVGVERGDKLRVGRVDGSGGLEFGVVWPPDVKWDYIAVYGNEIEESKNKQILGVSAKKGGMNDRSVVLVLKEGSYRALFTGDAGIQTEKEMVEGGWLPQIDYLKVGHHGSKNSTSLELLEAIKPKLAVISVGKKNRYGHPTQEVLERLKGLGIRTLRTDEIGDVVVEVGEK